MATYPSAEDAPTKLTTLFLTTVPENEHGRKTLTNLAVLLGVSRNGLQKWITNQHVPSRWVARLIEIGKIGQAEGADSRVSQEDFHEFVYNTPGS